MLSETPSILTLAILLGGLLSLQLLASRHSDGPTPCQTLAQKESQPITSIRSSWNRDLTVMVSCEAIPRTPFVDHHPRPPEPLTDYKLRVRNTSQRGITTPL